MGSKKTYGKMSTRLQDSIKLNLMVLLKMMIFFYFKIQTTKTTTTTSRLKVMIRLKLSDQKSLFILEQVRKRRKS